MMELRMRDWKLIALISPNLIFLLIFFYWPLSEILRIAFSNDLEAWYSLITDSVFLKFLVFTLSQTLLAVFFSVVFGLTIGYLLAKKNPYFSDILRSAITVPFLFPPLAILLGFVVIFGRNGIANEIFKNLLVFDPFTFWGIVAAHVLYNVSVIARISESAFSSESDSHHIMAKTLGASSWLRFKTITYPHIRPSVESGILLVALYSFNSFAIVLVLGEVKLQTLEVMIYRQSLIRLEYQTSSMLVLIQLGMNLLIIMIYTRRVKYNNLSSPMIEKKIIGKRNIWATVILVSLIIISWLPVAIVLRTVIRELNSIPDLFRTELLSGGYDRLLGTSSLRVLLNTLFFGLIVATIALIFALMMVFAFELLKDPSIGERLSLPVIILPMGTSAITLSFGILLTHGRFNYFSEFVWVYIISAQLIAALPFTTRIIFSSWKQVPKELILVSKTLGANNWQTFESVIYPFMKSALLVSFLFAFAISVGEFGATFFLSRGEWVTLSLAIHKMFNTRNILLPNFYALILIATAFLSFFIIEKVGRLEMKI
ncbi:MAG: iron ABC transporter permease [Candidatus Heimdallarchaeota archaeon]|nr:iron ABC transporter permease [Candidatus Heimdallarchaeota archaeon]